MPNISRRTILTTAAGSALVPALITACNPATVLPEVLKNPAVHDWLRQFSAALGASIAHDFLELPQDWIDGAREHIGRALNIERFCRADVVRLHEESPTPFVLVSVNHDPPQQDQCSPRDPLNDYCAMIIDRGADSVLLPAWAWQTILMFHAEALQGKSGELLEQTEALLSVSLAPTSSTTETGTSWANAISYVSYMTHMGPVDIAKVEEPDHSFKGHIKVAGFPDATSQGTVSKYDLPTRASS